MYGLWRFAELLLHGCGKLVSVGRYFYGLSVFVKIFTANWYLFVTKIFFDGLTGKFKKGFDIFWLGK